MPHRNSLVSLVLLALLVSAPAVQARTLKIATLAPAGTSWMKEMREGAKEVSERTDGRVKFKFYPGGVMGNDRSMLRKMRVGQLHGAALTTSGLAEVYRDSWIYTLPLLFRNYQEVDYVRERVDPLIGKGLEQHGLVTLGIGEGGFAYMMCDEPLYTVDDLKGKKVWIPEGDVIAEVVFEIAGVTPVPLPLADVYTGLQTGLVNTLGSPPMATIAFQWHTKVTHLTDVPLSYVVGLLVLDDKAFRRLKPEDQAVVREVMGRTMKRLDEINRADNDNARRALAGQGVEFVRPMGEELSRWRAIADQATERLGEQGAYTKEMYQIIDKHLTTFRSMTAHQ
ncbi:MAG: TRAP transporter substrate-binding protein DctP [Gammaproteobacteria bacterium]|nr:TRAP transporter substrate-binding protein DctP [Gammaproteobacteria bacterium]MDJ0891335.1 TRAP transporter substrate-binding protein DctP [Gammaproteobacteria bacterium]